MSRKFLVITFILLTGLTILLASAQRDQVKDIVFDITGRFEGGKPDSLQTIDAGIISYGKHQATLASGSLYNVLKLYTEISQTRLSKQMDAYLPRVKSRDPSLRDDATFLKLLKDAGSESAMEEAQNDIFSKDYYEPAKKKAAEDGITSALGIAIYYDTMVHSLKGLKDSREATKGHFASGDYTEQEWLSTFLDERKNYLTAVAENDRKKGDETTAGMLENAASSKGRIGVFKGLVEADNLDLTQGDSNGQISLGIFGKVYAIDSTYRESDDASSEVAQQVSSPNAQEMPRSIEKDNKKTETPKENAFSFGISQGLEPITQAIKSSSENSIAKNFVEGNRVKTTDLLNVRSVPGLPSDSSIDTRVSNPKSKGSIGTILDGPIKADGYTWWKIKYNDGTIGWSQDKRLELEPNQETSQDASQTKTQATSFGTANSNLVQPESVPVKSKSNLALSSTSSLDNEGSSTFGQKMADQARSLVGQGIKYKYGAELRKDGKILNLDEIKETGIDCAELTWWAANKAAGLSTESEESPLTQSYSGGQWSDTTKIDHESEPTANTIKGKMSNGDAAIIKSEPIIQGNHKWYLIEDKNGNQGYVAGEYLKSSSENAVDSSTSSEAKFNIGDKVASITNDLNIRSVPSTATGQMVSTFPTSNDLQAGDLLFLDTGTNPDKGKTEIDHVAVYVGNGNVVQASPKGDVKEMTLDEWQKLSLGDKTYGDYFYGYGRLKAAETSDESNFGGINFTSIKLNYISVSTDQEGGLNFDLGLKAEKAESGGKRVDIANTTRIGATAFLTGLAVSDSKFWVNLMPWEPDRIIDKELAESDVGRIMLEADLQMKKDFSNYGNPCNNKTGKILWDLMEKKRRTLVQWCILKFPGDIKDINNIQFRQVTRHWIVPDQIYAYENGTQIYIINATLTIKSESVSNHSSFQVLKQDGSSISIGCREELNKSAKEYAEYWKELNDQMILPYVVSDLNHDEKYEDLRNVYTSLALAQWYKSCIISKNNVFLTYLDSTNFTIPMPSKSWNPKKIWARYLYSFENGEYKCWNNTTTKTATGTSTRNNYVSEGGVEFDNIRAKMIEINNISPAVLKQINNTIKKGFINNGKDVFFGRRLYTYLKQETRISNHISDPDLALTWYNRGNTCLSQKKINESIEAYDEAIKLDPSLAIAWNNKGVALQNQGKLDEALDSFDNAIKLDPLLTEAQKNKDAVLTYREHISKENRMNMPSIESPNDIEQYGKTTSKGSINTSKTCPEG